jgi:arylsulfatase A-like enzyme
MTNQATAWMQAQHSLTPDKPFFVYFSTGALHAPHHVPKEYIDRYKDKFDQGWDALREETFARQKQMGVIPANAELTSDPKKFLRGIPKRLIRKSLRRGKWRPSLALPSTLTNK